jgi:hypothetical protein
MAGAALDRSIGGLNLEVLVYVAKLAQKNALCSRTDGLCPLAVRTSHHSSLSQSRQGGLDSLGRLDADLYVQAGDQVGYRLLFDRWP